jgi:hypothetical protein
MVHIKKKMDARISPYTPTPWLWRSSIGFSNPSDRFESLAFVVPFISEIWI